MTVITGEERDRYLAVLAEYRFIGFVVWLDDARRQLGVSLSSSESRAVISPKRVPEPFPWICPRCGQERVNPSAVPYRATRKYEGRSYELEFQALRVLQCEQCGERLFDIDADQQIERAFRATLGLLQPEEIREGRKELGLSQMEFAGKLRFAEESVSRWETGALVQSRHADTLIRLYFASPLLRQLLDQVGESPDFGRSVCYGEPGASAESPARPIRNLIPD
ncbi:MAG TPA: hypothetical protein PK867_17035 [Pirellulales bacterium]|nr:hypothetical protein [Pirellulales bacterium]